MNLRRLICELKKFLKMFQQTFMVTKEKILDFFLIQDVLTPKRINIGLLLFLATVFKHGIAILMIHLLMAIAKREFLIRTEWDIDQQNLEFQPVTFSKQFQSNHFVNF